MQLEHSFTVPVGVDEAWSVLLDIRRIAPCMPGAAVDSVDGDDFTGTVKVKLGPIGLTYKGKASFVEKDVAAHRAVIDARGRDARGNGTASAKVTATLTDVDGQTKVDVRTDLDITGKPAQFGRGVMVDVGNRLIGQFADCLATKLTGEEAATESPAGARVEPAAGPQGEATGELAAGEPAGAEEAVSESSATAGPAAGEPAVDEPSAVGTAAPAAPLPPASAVAAAAAAVEPAVRTAPAPEPSDAPPGTPADAAAHVPAAAAPEPEPIDLLQHAGPAVLKRAAPAVGALAVLVVLLRYLRSLRSSRRR